MTHGRHGDVQAKLGSIWEDLEHERRTRAVQSRAQPSDKRDYRMQQLDGRGVSARSTVEIQVTSQILSKGHSPGSVGTAASLATSHASSQTVVASNHLRAKVQSYNTACIRGSAASTRLMHLCARKCRLDR